MSSSYEIIKGVDKTIEFKGLSAQYLVLFIGSILVGVLIFAICQISGLSFIVNMIVTMMVIVPASIISFKFSKKYGKNGLMKLLARRNSPSGIRSAHKLSQFYKHAR